MKFFAGQIGISLIVGFALQNPAAAQLQISEVITSQARGIINNAVARGIYSNAKDKNAPRASAAVTENEANTAFVPILDVEVDIPRYDYHRVIPAFYNLRKNAYEGVLSDLCDEPGCMQHTIEIRVIRKDQNHEPRIFVNLQGLKFPRDTDGLPELVNFQAWLSKGE